MIPEPTIKAVLDKHSKESKYLDFYLLGVKPKTHIIGIDTKHEDSLGWIKWYAPWRQYVFEANNDCIFNVTCMNDIVKLTEAVNKLQKIKRDESST